MALSSHFKSIKRLDSETKVTLCGQRGSDASRGWMRALRRHYDIVTRRHTNHDIGYHVFSCGHPCTLQTMKRTVGMALWVLSGAVCAQDLHSLHERMKELPAQFEFEPGRMESAGRRILGQRDAVPCDSLLIGEYLVLQAAVARRVPCKDVDTVSCGEAPPLLVYMRSANAHLSGRYEEAVAGFQRVARTTHAPKLGVQALHAAGVVYSDLGAYDESFACLAQAYEMFPEECDHPLILLNLAAAAGMANKWQDALGWTELAEQALADELRAGGPAPNVRPEWNILILSSKLQAYMQLGRAEEAGQVFDQMAFTDIEGIRTAGVLGVVTAYVLQRDALVDFVSHLPELQAIADADTAAAVAELGVYASLYEPWRSQVWGELPLEAVWKEVRQLPLVLGSIGKVGEGWAPGTSGDQRGHILSTWPFLVRTVRWGAAVLFLVAVGGIAQAGGMWRARRRAQRWSAEREVELVQSLRKRLAGLDGRRAGAEVRWLLVEVVRRRGLARLMRLGEGMRNLTRREEEFVIHLAAGLRTKEFARIHRLSSGHVYNLSSSVRRKLQVPESVELSDFIMAKQRKGE